MSARALDTGAVMRPAQADEPPREQSDVDPAGCESLERRLALDLLTVLEAEVPDANAVVVGLELALEARRREARA